MVFTTGVVQPVENWVRNSFDSPKKWARKVCNFLARGSKGGAQLHILRIRLYRPCTNPEIFDSLKSEFYSILESFMIGKSKNFSVGISFELLGYLLT